MDGHVGQASACPVSVRWIRDRLKPVLHFFAVAFFAASAFAWGGAPDWLKQIARAPLPAYPEDTRGVALLDETVTTVTPSGEIRTLHRRAYKILSTAGRDLAYVAVHFDSETKLTAFRAWAFTAKGEEYQVKERDAVEAAAFDGELYADNRMKVLRIPAAEPGNVVGFEFEQLERPYGLQDVWHFQDDIPVLRARYSVSLPEGWKHEERWFNATAKDPQGSGNQIAWELNDVAALKDEPGMPALAAIAGRMAINFIPPSDALQGKTHRTWNDVARWYNALAASRRAPSPLLQAKAKELTATQTTSIDRIRALAAFAQRDVRYVAIEIGIGGWQPHAAADIFANRYGDCKDKVTVLGTMLREIGVDSFYVLINTSRGTVDRDFATHQAFNHAIIAIRLPKDAPAKGLHATIDHPKLGKLLLFDPTSANTPFGVLPPYLQETRALLVSDDGGELIEIPAHPPEASQLARNATLKLDTTGKVEGDVREVRTGAIATDYRNSLQVLNEAERKQMVERALAYHLTQYELRDLAIENLDDVSKDLVITYKLVAPSYGKRASGMLLVRPRVLGRKAEGIVDLKDRKVGYETQGPVLEVDDVTMNVPAGLAADELPPPQKLATPVVSYASESKFEGSVLHYRREYRVLRFGVPLEGLPELNATFSKILADERSSAVLIAK